MARRQREGTLTAAQPGANSPEWLTITATITTTADGAIAQVTKPGEASIDLRGDSEGTVRRDVLNVAREFVVWLGRPVRLRVTDSTATWPLVVNPNGSVVEEGEPDLTETTATASQSATGVELRAVEPEVEQDAEDSPPERRTEDTPADPPRPARPAIVASDEHETSSSTATPPAPARHTGPGRRPPRRAPSKGRAARLMASVRQGLKDKAELREEELDAELARRHVVRRENKIAVVSVKGGSGKSLMSVVIGDVLASRLPDQRVAAIDFNPGGGVLSAVTSEDRAAERTMLELHNDRGSIRSHAQLQPYVASLASGLDVLSVPPDVGLALLIKPEHYAEMFTEILDDAYTLMVLDTSPDVTSAVTQLALDTATQMVIVCGQGYMESGVVTNALPYLLSTPAAGGDGSMATVVINGVIGDERAGRVEDVRSEILSVDDQLPIIEVPMDLDLRSEMNSGTYTLDHIKRRSTRLPLKELSLQVMRRFV
jgi:MinD-like ATPase involved in chromosome partitioning or flagellar assembly